MTLVFGPGTGALPDAMTVYDAAQCLDCQIAQPPQPGPWFQHLARPDRAMLRDPARDLTLELTVDGQDRPTGISLRAPLTPGLPQGEADIPRRATPARLLRWGDGAAVIAAHRQGRQVVIRLGGAPEHYLALAVGVWVGLDPQGRLCALAFDTVLPG